MMVAEEMQSMCELGKFDTGNLWGSCLIASISQ